MSNDEDRLPLLRQVDAWLGRRHRAHFIWVSFLAGLGAFWLLQTAIINRINQNTYDKIVSEMKMKQDRIDELQDQITYLKDSIANIHAYGIHFGHYELYRGDVQAIYAEKVVLENRTGHYLDIEIDTCRGYYRNCQEWRGDLPLEEGGVSPILHGSIELLVVCQKKTDSLTVIDVYKPLQP